MGFIVPCHALMGGAGHHMSMKMTSIFTKLDDFKLSFHTCWTDVHFNTS